MNKISILAVIAAAGLTTQLSTVAAHADLPPIWSQTAPISTQVVQGGILFQPTLPETAHFPTGSSVFSQDIVDSAGVTKRQVSIAYSSHDDSTAVAPTGGALISTDSGATFSKSSQYSLLAPSSDGSLLDISTGSGGVSGNTVYSSVRHSLDGGRTWAASQPAVMHLDVPIVPGHGTITAGQVLSQVDSSGRSVLLMPYYTYTQTSTTTSGWRVELARSYDDAVTWNTIGVIANPGVGQSFSETAIAFLPNGSLYAVFRTEGPYQYSISANGGVTWDSPKTLTATPLDSNIPSTWTGVDPGITLLPNGLLVMVGGRPDNYVAVSRGTLSDGSPRWINKQMIYSNYPTLGQAVRTRGSSGYEGITPVGSSNAFVAVDNCGPNPWGCPATSWGWTQSNIQKLMKISLTADAGAGGVIGQTANGSAGKIDINGLLRSGKAVLTKNDFTATDSKHPTLRPYGAFDVSADYWSSALSKTGKPATMTIKLDKTRTLTKAGLSLQPGLSGNATVSYGADGVHWKSISKITQFNSHSIHYYAMPAGTSARYVRVVVQPSKVTARGIGTSAAMLNELELYS